MDALRYYKKISLLAVAILFLFTFFNLILDAPRTYVDIKHTQFKKLTWSQQAFMSRFSSSGNQLMMCGLLFSSLISFLTS
jgi:hypothetical protein